MKAKIFGFALLVAVVFVFSPVSAQVPNRISYQGKLVTPQGGLIDTTVSMVFAIYTDSTSGTQLWTETQNSVVVSKSVFNVILGSVTSIPKTIFNGSIRYLGITVGGDSQMTPRKPIVSVGYAYKSLEADTAGYARVGALDNDWKFSITDGADTTITTGGAWGIARYGNTLYGNADSTHVTLGIASTTGKSGQNYKYCTVGGGLKNTARYPYGTVGGGLLNIADNNYTTVGGGGSNTASGTSATIAGGVDNTASNGGATVGGGEQNTASGMYATIGGGYDNSAGSWYSSNLGGYSNHVGGQYGTVVGGIENDVSADYSIAAGEYVTILSAADNTFAFGNHFSTSTPHAVIFYDNDSPIKLGVQITAPTHYIDVAGGAYCNGTNWVNASSRKYKKDISSLTPAEYREILQKLAQTEVVRFRYKSEDSDRLHIGVIAEDAPEEMVDAERTGIPTGDAIGFLLAALKAQQEKMNAQQEQIEALRAKLEKLESDR